MARRFWYDTEFVENPGCIDLISIGIVDESGRTYYAVSNEFDESKASDWVRENVLRHLPPREEWKSREQIRLELIEFFKPSKEDPVELWGYYSAYDHVALCWLFGRMIDLPEGMPMFTNDLTFLRKQAGWPALPKQEGFEHDALEDAKWNFIAWQYLTGLLDSTSGSS